MANPVPRDYGPFEVGGTLQPLPTSSGNSLLRDADPPVFYALDYFSYLITTYAGPRLMNAVQMAGLGSVIQSPVAQQYPILPQPFFQSNQFRFPLLCVARTGASTRRHTAGWESDRWTFDVLYVLPPLTEGQSELMLPVRKAVYDALRHKATQGFDPGYTPPGGTIGQQPWALCGVESIGFGHELNEAKSVEYGALEGTGNIYFPSIRMLGYFVERDMYVPAANKFAGADMEIDLLGPDGSVAQHFMDLATQQAPSVTSIAPTGGTIAGGTSVTLTGTLFLPAPRVLFGPYRATSVTWNSATNITATTPAISGPGTVSVTIQNRDGQAGSLQNAFTYS
jgi:IPT/TIG domain